MKRLGVLFSLCAAAVGPIQAQSERVDTPIAPGVTYLQVTRPGPLRVHVLKVDLSERSVSASVALGGERVLQLEPLSQIVARTGQTQTVVGGINGGYALLRDDPFRGSPIGLLIANGELVSDPWPTPRSALLLPEGGRPRIEVVALRATVTGADGRAYRLGGLNRRRLPGELVAYTSHFNPSTRVLEPGRQVVLRGVFGEGETLVCGHDYQGRVEAAVDGRVNVEIPTDGLVLAGSGPAAAWLAGRQLGETVAFRCDLLPDLGPLSSAVGAGPRIVRDGKVSIEAEQESLQVALTAGQGPRSAIGFNDAFLYLAVVDGRASDYSVGMTLGQLAQFMIEQGCTQAMALDGGGSSTMYVRDRVVNRPSDGVERAIADAILLTTTGAVTTTPLPSPVVSGSGVAPATPPGAELPPVTPPASSVARIALSPGELVVSVGETRQLTVAGESADGQPVPVDLKTVTFEVTPPLLGRIDEQGRFTAAKPGNGRIAVRFDDKVATIVVKVVTGASGELPTIVPPQPVVPGDEGPTPVAPGSEEPTTVTPSDEGTATTKTPGDETTPPTETPADEGTPTSTAPGDENAPTNRPAQESTTTAPPGADQPRSAPELPKGERKLIDGFESSLHWQLKVYPPGMVGNVSIVKTPRYQGNASCKLRYDFTTMDVTRAVYAVYRHPIGSPKAVSVWVFGDGNGHWLRGRFRDKFDEIHYVDFAEYVNWDHYWARCTAIIPEDVKGPIIWDEIYLVQHRPEVKSAGAIYLDQFEGIYAD